ncbi:MAG: hypothetical protein AABX01_05650 [Candidatus Micrarchaeota archaeon]
MAIIASSFLLMGCTENGNQDGGNGAPYQGRPGDGYRNGSGFRNGTFGGPRNGSFGGNGSGIGGFGNGTFGNMTDEQRAQMQKQRMQEALTACKGKSDGDACAVQNPRGELKGKCIVSNRDLICMGDFGERNFTTPPINR